MGQLAAPEPRLPASDEAAPDPVGAVTISAGLATAMAAGGVVTGVVVMRTDMRSGAILGVATVLYVFGAAAGLMLGSLLGMMGRPEAMETSEAMGRVRSAWVKSAPLLAAGWPISVGIACTGLVLRSGPWPLLVLVAVAWGIAAFVGIWAAVEGAKAVWNALAR